MELKFNSVEEVLQFVVQLRPQPTPIARPAVMEPLDAFSTLQRAATGNKISAIKIYRALTGLGLKESKEAVDKMQPFSGRF